MAKPAINTIIIKEEYSCKTMSAFWYQPEKRLTIVASTMKTPNGRPIDVLPRNCFFSEGVGPTNSVKIFHPPV